jgi:hypothetical protein
VEPLPYVDQLVDETSGARFFTKLDLATAYMQFRIRDEAEYKTSFRVPDGHYEFRVGAFGLHGMSSVLMRYMHSIFGRPVLSFDAAGRGQPAGTRPGPPMLGCFVQVYCDDILIFSKARNEHLVDVRMELETLRHRQLFAKASKCQFGRSSVGFLAGPRARDLGSRGCCGSAKGRRRVGTAGRRDRGATRAVDLPGRRRTRGPAPQSQGDHRCPATG